jgi:hypothetical protein
VLTLVLVVLTVVLVVYPIRAGEREPPYAGSTFRQPGRHNGNLTVAKGRRLARMSLIARIRGWLRIGKKS